MTQASSLAGGMARSAALFFIARVISYVVALALPMVLVRILSQHDYGLYKQLFLVIGSLVNYLPLGFAMNMYYFFPRLPERHPVVIANTLYVLGSIGIVATTLLCLNSGLLGWIAKDNSILHYAPVVGILAALWMTVYAFELLPIVMGETRIVVVLSVAVQLSRSGLLLLAALWFGTVSSLLWALLIQLLLQACAFLIYLHRRFPGFWRHLDLVLIRQQVVYILKISSASIVFSLVSQDVHQYAVSNRFGPEIFAIYAAGCFQIPLSAILIEAIGPLLIREANRLESIHNRPAVLSLMLNSSRQLGLILFPLFALLAAVASEFILFFFTNRYSASIPIFLVNLTLIPMAALVSDPISRAYPELQSAVIRFRLVLSLVLAAAIWMLTPVFGPIAAISCVSAGLLTDRVAMSVYWGRFLGFRWSEQKSILINAGAIFAISIFAGAVTLLAKPMISGLPLFWVLAIASMFFVVTYVGLLLAFSIPNQQEMQMAHRLVSRISPRWLRR